MDDAIPVTDLTEQEGPPVAPAVQFQRKRAGAVAVQMSLGPIKLALGAGGRPGTEVVVPLAIVVYLVAATIPAAGTFVAGQVLRLPAPVVGVASLAAWAASVVLVAHLLRTGRPEPRSETRRTPDGPPAGAEEGGHDGQHDDDGGTPSPIP